MSGSADQVLQVPLLLESQFSTIRPKQVNNFFRRSFEIIRKLFRCLKYGIETWEFKTIALICCILVFQISGSVALFWASNTLANVVGNFLSGNGISTTLLVLSGLLTFYVVCVSTIAGYVEACSSVWFQREMRLQITKKLQRVSVLFQLSMESDLNTIDQRFTSDVEVFSTTAFSLLFGFPSTVASLVTSSIYAAVSFNITSLIVCFLFSALTIIVSTWLAVYTSEGYLPADSALGKTRRIIANFVDHLKEISSWLGSKVEFSIMSSVIMQYRSSFSIYYMKCAIQDFWSGLTLAYAQILPYILILLLLAFHDSSVYDSSTSTINTTAATTAVAAFSSLISAILVFPSLWTQIVSLGGYTFRVCDMIDEIDELCDESSESSEQYMRKLVDRLEIQQLDVISPTGNLLVKNVKWTIFRGKNVLLQGANGVGKTCLLKMLAGLSPNSDRSFQKHVSEIAFIPPHHSLLPSTLIDLINPKVKSSTKHISSVMRALLEKINSNRDAIELIMPIANVRENILNSSTKATIMSCFDDSNLSWLKEEFAESNESTEKIIDWEKLFSNEDKQRVQIAQLLYSKPMYAFLDESLSLLPYDEQMHALETLNKYGITVILVSHWRFHQQDIERLFQGGRFVIEDETFSKVEDIANLDVSKPMVEVRSDGKTTGMVRSSADEANIIPRVSFASITTLFPLKSVLSYDNERNIQRTALFNSPMITYSFIGVVFVCAYLSSEITILRASYYSDAVSGILQSGIAGFALSISLLLYLLSPFVGAISRLFAQLVFVRLHSESMAQISKRVLSTEPIMKQDRLDQRIVADTSQMLSNLCETIIGGSGRLSIIQILVTTSLSMATLARSFGVGPLLNVLGFLLLNVILSSVRFNVMFSSSKNVDLLDGCLRWMSLQVFKHSSDTIFAGNHELLIDYLDIVVKNAADMKLKLIKAQLFSRFVNNVFSSMSFFIATCVGIITFSNTTSETIISDFYLFQSLLSTVSMYSYSLPDYLVNFYGASGSYGRVLELLTSLQHAGAARSMFDPDDAIANPRYLEDQSVIVNIVYPTTMTNQQQELKRACDIALKLDLPPEALVESLSTGQRTRVILGRLLFHQWKISTIDSMTPFLSELKYDILEALKN
jgi:ABC-type uncharacterized transport system fused permease/ATPase subunit